MKITSRQIALVFGRPTGTINAYARKHGYESTESTYEYQQTTSSKVVTYPCLEFDVQTAYSLCCAMFPLEKDKIPAEWKDTSFVANPVIEQRSITTAVSLEAVAASETMTMSSREIAELTGSTHDNVLKTVRTLVQKGVVFGNETLYTHHQNGQTYTEFKLSYRDTMVVVSGYSVELRAKIIDRWQELEAQVKPVAPALPNFANPAEAAIAWAEQWKAKAEAEKLVQEQKEVLELQAPKVEALKLISEGDENMTVTNAAKVLQTSPKKLFSWMSEQKWIYRNNNQWIGYQTKIDAGLLKHKITWLVDNYGNGKYVDQVRVTRKGLTTLAEKMV